MPKPFPCTACGAPVTAEPGLEIMACPYCATTLTIPPRLRRKKIVNVDSAPAAKPRDPFSAAASVKLDDKAKERSQRETEMLTSAMRRAQPIATQAAKIYNFWVLAKYFLPGILVALAVMCLLSCAVMTGLAIYFAQR